MARSASAHELTIAVPHHAGDETVESLEGRVHRLEDAVAAMQDTQLMEDRVVERVRQRIDMHHLEGPRPSGGLILNAARMLLPKPVEEAHGEPPSSEPGAASGDAPAANGTGARSTEAARPGWLFVELYREVRGVFRMLGDYRYRMSWPGRIVPLAALVAALLSWFLISGIPFIGGLIDRAIDLVLILVIYKSMSREMQRYRELLMRSYRYR